VTTFLAGDPRPMDWVLADDFVHSNAWLLIAFPLIGAVVLLAGGRRTDRWGHYLGCATVLASFAYGVLLLFQSTSYAAGQRSQEVILYSWMPAAELQVDFGLLLDPLSISFVLLITGVGALIHIYAVGYMADDVDRRRFFGYFNLFVAAMLILVLGNNFVALYLGWEGVGLASYLLIGWYQHKPYAATAAKKAFIMNRVGDVGLALAIFVMWREIGSISYAEVFAGIGDLDAGVILAIGLLLLLGACGKSGQFPLQAWLPDAMEGPTPVSALIHAATMVTAGVYLIARSHVIFSANLTLQTVVVSVGAATLLIGAIIGCAKDDIKRVLAWSTVSQIGYMFLAVGLGGAAYALGIIHLLAHGFFKAGLFLGSGSVMHAMNDQTNIRRFGGLWRVMPWTYATFAAGWLAIIGMFPASGYFSKDPIIYAAFARPGWEGWAAGGAALLGAALTAFYMTRLFVLTFHGPRRWSDDVHPHESPAIMTGPLVVLGLGSLAAGALMASPVVDWLTPVFGAQP
jgi:NADH-quinone oxidoreductase subunit L